MSTTNACIQLHNILEWHKTDINNYVSKEYLMYDNTSHSMVLYCGSPVLHTVYYTYYNHELHKYEWRSMRLDTTLTIDWNILNTTISPNYHYIAIRINDQEIKLYDMMTCSIVAARAVKSTTNNNCMMLNAYFIPSSL